MKDSYSKIVQEWVKKRSSGKHYAHDLLEKPAIYSLLSDNINGLNVLCLGCGDGSECGFIKSQGADEVVGVDISKGLIESAKYIYPDAEFIHSSIENYDFGELKWDLIFSSLALHYVEDLDSIFKKAFAALKPGGKLIFSMHHPLKWGSQASKNSDYNEFLMGYKKYKKDNKWEVYGDYLTSRKVSDRLFNSTDIEFYHKPISKIINSIIGSGLQLETFLEPLPLPNSAKIKPDFFDVYSKIPLFMVFKISKPE